MRVGEELPNGRAALMAGCHVGEPRILPVETYWFLAAQLFVYLAYWIATIVQCVSTGPVTDWKYTTAFDSRVRGVPSNKIWDICGNALFVPGLSTLQLELRTQSIGIAGAIQGLAYFGR